MKKRKISKNWYIIGIIILLSVFGIAFLFYRNNFTGNNNSSYNAQKTATNNNSSNEENSNSSETSNSNSDENPNTSESNSTNSESTSNNFNTSESNNANNNSNASQTNEQSNSSAPQETQIASFSTKIYTKESGRQNNMNITASRLNGHIVKNGETFSFCNTLGPSSSAKGYQKADIFDNSGQKKKGLGGGNCQVSSTLYNAILAAPGLTVIERHTHSNYVPYIQKGKDAAVAYGSYDLKFRNDSGKDVKLLFEVTNNSVTSTINQIG